MTNSLVPNSFVEAVEVVHKTFRDPLLVYKKLFNPMYVIKEAG